MVWSSSTAGSRASRRTCYAVALALAAISTSAQTPEAEFCATNKAVLNVGFYADFRPMSYSADLDPNSAGFNVHGGYEADLLNALEALEGANLSFVRRGIGYWAPPGEIPIWQLATTPEYDIVGGGITILDSRTRNAADETIVAFTMPHVAFRQSILVRAEDAERLANYADLTRTVRVGVLAGTTGEARFLQITGLADANGILATGSRVETPDGTVEADGSDNFRITSSAETANLGGRLRLIPPTDAMPTVVYLGGETELLQALREGMIDAVARGVLGNGEAARAEGGRFAVTAVDPEAEHGGFTVDARDTALLACLNDAISWLTNGRRIGFVEWVDDSQVFMKRAMLWNNRDDVVNLETGDVWRRPLSMLFPASQGRSWQFTARSHDPTLVAASVQAGVLTITSDADAGGTVGVTVTASDAAGNRTTLLLVVVLELTEPRGVLRGWRLPWLAGELAPPTAPMGSVEPMEPSGWTRGVFDDAATFADLCQVPRPDSVDRRGTTLDENNWLRSWSNDTYLWYDEIEDRDPACCSTPAYFNLLRTTAKTPSGRDRDRFHFTYDTAEWIALSQSGVSAGYGAQFVLLQPSPPRDIRVAYTEPNTPATRPRNGMALIRGTRILEIDGVDVRAGNDVDTLNAGLFPNTGETHEFLVQDPGGTPRTVVMEAAVITRDPVQHIRVLSTATGPVGYLLFNDHIATAEAQLVDAMQSFQTAEITDLVLDLRYNGGGRLSIANRLAAMIAGGAAQGQTFEELQFNDKHRVFNPVTRQRLEPYLFEARSSDGVRLPSLDLERLFVLTGPRTCSASESIINGLRGIDLDVVLIGDTTCGKPYGFYPTDNCGTTYFTIQIKGVNAKGFGDFTDGFSPANVLGTKGTEVPGCAVFDDFDHQFGDPEEARLQAALQYRIDGECPGPSGRGADTDAAADTPTLATGGRSVRQPTPIGLKVLDW